MRQRSAALLRLSYLRNRDLERFVRSEPSFIADNNHRNAASDGVGRFSATRAAIHAFHKPHLLPELAREFRGYDDDWYYRQFWREDLDPVSRLQYVDMKTYLPDDILTKVDRASMAVSLEVRPPLLDHEFVEFIATLPPEFRYDKRVFRAAVADLLPAATLTRRKMGFSVPLVSWLPPLERNGVQLIGLARWAVEMLDTWRSSL